jgi:hypothetical protein
MSKSWRTALIVGALVAVFAATSDGAAKFITGDDIKNGSVGLKDLSKRAKRALKGQTGPAGPAGATGPQGPAGPASLSTTVRSADFTAVSNEARGEVRCPDGMVAVGGTVSPGDLFTITDLPSSDGRGWVGDAVGPNGATMRIAVICTPGSANVLPTGS